MNSSNCRIFGTDMLHDLLHDLLHDMLHDMLQGEADLNERRHFCGDIR